MLYPQLIQWNFGLPRYQPRDAHNAYRAQTREARHSLATVFAHGRPWEVFFCPKRRLPGRLVV